MMIPVRYGGIMKYRLLNDGWEFTLSDTKEHIELGMNTSLWREVKYRMTGVWSMIMKKIIQWVIEEDF